MSPPIPVLLKALKTSHDFFVRGTSTLTEADAGFAPRPGMFTVAQQVAHAAQTLDWFRAGAFSATGFDMDFPAHQAAVQKIASLQEARAWFERAYDALAGRITQAGEAGMQEAMAPGPIMGGMPRFIIVDAIADHTAHHRGALAVYCRLTGKVPPMPYL